MFNKRKSNRWNKRHYGNEKKQKKMQEEFYAILKRESQQRMGSWRQTAVDPYPYHHYTDHITLFSPKPKEKVNWKVEGF